jgi:hypothetical protein
LLANASTINVGNISTGTIKAGNISTTTLRSDTIDTDFFTADTGQISSISTTSIQLDGNFLDTGGGGFGAVLLLNGVPIATIDNISSIADWSFYPAFSTIQVTNNDIIDAKNIFGSNITLQNSITATMGGIRTLNTSNITTSNNILTNTLDTTGDTTIGGTLRVQTARFSGITTSSITNAFGITAQTGSFSTLNVSSLVAPPVTSYTSLTVQELNGVSSIKGNTLAVATPNFLTVNTVTNLTATNDRGADVGGASVINLRSRFGQNTQVNITADSASVLSPLPAQSVNITANASQNEGGVAGGGAVNIVANAQVGDTTSLLGNGAIRLTANSALSTPPVPGVILLSGGSVSIYSGPVTPIVGVFGYNYLYGTLGNYIAAGVPPGGVPAFAGTNYLYGTNGTSINNGLSTDNITSYGTSNLTITAQSSRWVDIQRAERLSMGNNPLIDFVDNNGRITGLSSLNGVTYPPNNIILTSLQAQQLITSSLTVNTINGSSYPPAVTIPQNLTVSTLNSQQVSTNSLLISSINGAAYPPSGGGGWVSTATSALNMNGNGIGDNTGFLTISSIDVFVGGVDIAAIAAGNNSTNTVAAFTSSSIDLLQFGGAGFIRRNAAGNIIDTATGNIQTQATSTINTVPNTYFSGNTRAVTANLTTSLNSPQVNTSSLLISTINGSAYPPASIWVSTASSRLNMNGNGITDDTGLLTLSSINVGIAASTSVGLVAGEVSTGVSILLVSPNQIDLVSPTVTRDLVGVAVAQPVIQYGEDGVSGASGSVGITLTTPYTSVSSYVAFACMMDTNPAQIAVNRVSDSQITLEWASAGAGSHRIGWQTMGT